MKELEIENQRLRALVEKLSNRQRGTRSEDPLASESQFLRQDFGCGVRSPSKASGQSRGASLGRIASVRCTR
jgi:putative transposase